MKLTLLGTGTSMGVPQPGCFCRVCTSTDPRDHRNRTAALIESRGNTILIDTPPELRLQLVQQRTRRIDAVLYTHHHADHINGIDDLRAYSLLQREAIAVYASADTAAQLRCNFSYIFDGIPALPGTSKPGLKLHPVRAGVPFMAAGEEILPLQFQHGEMPVLGYRLGRIAYITDVKEVDDATAARLQGLDVLVLNALRHAPHPTHLSISEAIEAAGRIGAKQTVLTHLTHECSHAELAESLPRSVEPGYDGMTVEVG